MEALMLPQHSAQKIRVLPPSYREGNEYQLIPDPLGGRYTGLTPDEYALEVKLYFSKSALKLIKHKLGVVFPAAIQLFACPGRVDAVGIKFVPPHTPDSYSAVDDEYGVLAYVNFPAYICWDIKFTVQEVADRSTIDLVLEFPKELKWQEWKG